MFLFLLSWKHTLSVDFVVHMIPSILRTDGDITCPKRSSLTPFFIQNLDNFGKVSIKIALT